MYLESISVIGYLGQDPRSNTVNGKTVCNFSVSATNPRTKKSTWYRVAVWGGLAEPCMKFLAKGKPVYVDGSLEIKEWQKDGTSDKQFEIQARNVQFLSSPTERKEAIAEPGYAAKEKPVSESGYGHIDEPNFDNIPF